MRKNDIYITEYDYERLSDLIAVAVEAKSKDHEYAIKLKQEIEKAKIVSPEHIAGQVVTMNSRIVLKDLSTAEVFNFQIVFPSEANIENGKISVLAPIGTALLGYKVGDTVHWKVPEGVRKIKIKKMVYQPESEGDWYL